MSPLYGWHLARSLSENREPTRQLLLRCSTYVHPCTSTEKALVTVSILGQAPRVFSDYQLSLLIT